jgi:hypothetical protein
VRVSQDGPTVGAEHRVYFKETYQQLPDSAK